MQLLKDLIASLPNISTRDYPTETTVVCISVDFGGQCFRRQGYLLKDRYLLYKYSGVSPSEMVVLSGS